MFSEQKMEKEISYRAKAIGASLRKKKLNCLIVTNPANVSYVTGFGGHDSWAVITPRTVYLLTDSRYSEQAQKECVNCRIIERADSMAKSLKKLVARHGKIAAVEASTPVGVFGDLKKELNVKLKAVSGIIEQLRAVKDAAEISFIEKAGKIAKHALSEVEGFFRPGISESQLAGLIELEIRKAGAKVSFETIAAFGVNASRPHHQPTNRKLRKNDTVLIDFGVMYNGYCCDITRCFGVGRVGRLYEKVYGVVQEAQAAAIRAVMPGVKLAAVDAAAREVIAAANLPVYGHGTGHGLGLEVHEQPIVSAKAKGRLEASMVITIEPAVYMPGKLGIRIEDDVVVTESGCKVLTG